MEDYYGEYGVSCYLYWDGSCHCEEEDGECQAHHGGVCPMSLEQDYYD